MGRRAVRFLVYVGSDINRIATALRARQNTEVQEPDIYRREQMLAFVFTCWLEKNGQINIDRPEIRPISAAPEKTPDLLEEQPILLVELS